MLGSYSNDCWDYKLLWCSSEQSCRYVLKTSLYLSPILNGMTSQKTKIVTLKLHLLVEPRGSTQLTSKLKIERNHESVPYTCHLPKICLNYILFYLPSGISTTIFCFPYLVYISIYKNTMWCEYEVHQSNSHIEQIKNVTDLQCLYFYLYTHIPTYLSCLEIMLDYPFNNVITLFWMSSTEKVRRAQAR